MSPICEFCGALDGGKDETRCRILANAATMSEVIAAREFRHCTARAREFAAELAKSAPQKG
jgi:hypothetical protein